MSRSNPKFVDDDAPTLEFEVPGRAGHREPQPRGDDPAHGDVVTADEAAAILGVSRWSLYAAANRHEVPHRRLGRRMLFSRRALLLWLEGASPRGVGKE
jgi:excisionase family DNA binding protein